MSDEITVYGIENKSEYISLNLDNNINSGIFVSNGILEKYGLEKGDTLNLKTKYSDNTYSFEIIGNYNYPAALTVFMSRTEFCKIFDKENNYFNGYFSNSKLDDIDKNSIASTLTQSDMTIVSDQLTDSMGNMFPMISGFAILLYMLLVYLLSKIIIEKNAVSISMVKILGYRNSEITKLYILPTVIVVIISLIISIPLAYLFIKLIYVQIISSFSGWLNFSVKPVVYIKMIALAIISYAVIGALQLRKIKKIPMEEALKNAE